MPVSHISQDEAISNFGRVMARVRSGEEVRIDEGATTIAIIHPVAGNDNPRMLSDIVAGLQRSGSRILLDEDFGKAVEEGIRSHAHERLIDPWESS